MDDPKSQYVKLLEGVAIADKYGFDQQRVGFYYNTDAECKKEFGFEEDGRYLMMLTGIHQLESHIVIGPNE